MQYFISSEYIKINSPITYNNDDKDLYSHVASAEKIHLQSVLGSDFFDYLKGQYLSKSLNADEIILVQDWVQPALMWRTIQLALPFIQYQLRNKGLMANTDDNANLSGFTEFKFMLNETSNRAQFQENELVKYLCKNNKLFPLFNNQTGLTQPDTRGRWNSGLAFY